MRKLILCAAAAATLGGAGAAFAQVVDCSPQAAGFLPEQCLPERLRDDYRSGYGPYGYGPEPGAGFAWGTPQSSWPVGPDNYYIERMRDLDGDGIRNDLDPDIDGDGVRNRRDRYPADPRYA